MHDRQPSAFRLEPMLKGTRPAGVSVLMLVLMLVLLAWPAGASAQSTKVITTVAGGGTNSPGDDGPATAAQLGGPAGVAMDGAGNLYIADASDNRIRKVTAATGVITTVAGTGASGFNGDGQLATAASLSHPTGVALDGAGNLYIADTYNNRIRFVAAGTGQISTIAGSGTYGYNGDDISATAANLATPTRIALDPAGNLYIADQYNQRVRRVDAGTGMITTVAGTGAAGFNGDGIAATAAQLYLPMGVFVDQAGNLFIADYLNHRIRKVSGGIITTVTGTGIAGFSGDGGPAALAQVNGPTDVAMDASGTLYVADYDNNRVRKVAGGIITTVTGTGIDGFSGDGGPAALAQLNGPVDVTTDPSGTLYIADYLNNRLRRVATPRRADFTGDLKSDVLWRHASLGEVWLWPMDGAANVSQTLVRTVADTNWEIRGLGDQTGDGLADIVWRHKTAGMVYLWPMAGTTPLAETYVATVDPAYDIVGTGDLDGDGKSDILWRHSTVGDVWIWLMDGPAVLAEVYVDRVAPGYVVKGLGDLDGDTKADIVWHGSAGDVWVWLMDGTTRLSQNYVGSVPDANYQIQEVADFDGNGTADLLWWNTVQGDVWLWPMSGATVLSESYVGVVPDTNYRIMAAGDYDGDTKADILWRNIVQGDVWVWLMDGTMKLSETHVGTVPDTGYQIVKAK